MANIRTHYDNLKVTRNAPANVIKAAYKALSQKYHPDKNGGNINAEKTMKIINTSYAILIDPIKRAEHDNWIKIKEQTKQENKNEQPNTTNDVHKEYNYNKQYSSNFTETEASTNSEKTAASSLLIWIGIIITLISLFTGKPIFLVVGSFFLTKAYISWR